MHRNEAGRDSGARLCAAALLATIATASCAAHPNDVATQNVNAAQYNNYSCPDLANEYRRLNEAIAGASDYQRSVRVADIYGYIPIPPVPHIPMPTGRMLGSDREAQIAYLLGEQAAAIQIAVEKGCIRAAPMPLADTGFIVK